MQTTTTAAAASPSAVAATASTTKSNTKQHTKMICVIHQIARKLGNQSNTRIYTHIRMCGRFSKRSAAKKLEINIKNLLNDKQKQREKRIKRRRKGPTTAKS